MSLLQNLELEKWHVGKLDEVLKNSLQSFVENLKTEGGDFIKGLGQDLLDDKPQAEIKRKLKGFIKSRFEKGRSEFLQNIQKK